MKTKNKIITIFMLSTALCMMSCRSSKPTLEQRQTVQVFDTVRQVVLIVDTLHEQQTVYDTLRETTTIALNAQGDTVSRTTEREHISDRTRERARATQQVATTESNHQVTASREEKEAVVEQPKAIRWKNILVGFLCGIVIGWVAIEITRKSRK